MTGSPLDGGAGDGLGAASRALLDAARDGLAPDAAAVRRVHARIQVATGGAAAGTAVIAKLGVVAVVAAVAIGAAVYATRGAAPPANAPEAAVSAPAPVAAAAPPASPAIREPAAGPMPVAAAAPVAAAHADDDRIELEVDPHSAPAAPPRRVEPRHRAAPGAGPVPPAPRIAAPVAPRAGIELGREVALIDLAMAALRRGDAGAALRVAQEYDAEAAGGGQLAQDAAAIEVEALCRLRDPAAPGKLAAFDARYPRSAQRARLEAACR